MCKKSPFYSSVDPEVYDSTAQCSRHTSFWNSDAKVIHPIIDEKLIIMR